jgi:hypothetical protein
MTFHKFKVAPAPDRTYNGRTYGSKAEMHYAMRLDIEKQACAIVEYIAQPKFHLGCPENVYVADFLVIGDPAYGQTPFVVDVKGVETQKFKHDKKLWAQYGRLPLHIVKKVGNKFKTVDVIEPRSMRAAA